MRIFVIALVFSFLFTVFATIAKAEEATPGSRQKPPREKVEMLKERVEQNKLAQARGEAPREKMATRSALLRERLAKFKNQNKATIVGGLNDNLNRINEVKTEAMKRKLEIMTQLLTKFEGRINAVTDKDTSETKAAITIAKDKIASAEAAVEIQSQKDYTLTATSEATIKQEVMTARNTLHSDLKAVHEQVKAARMSVVEAVETAAKTLGGN